MKWYFEVLKKYAVFTGRARRQEYWMFVLFNVIASIIISIIEMAIFGIETAGETGILSTIYSLGVLLPSLAVGVRRIHDTGKSGWFILVPIYNLILMFIEGDAGENEYGPDPKGQDTPMGETLDGHLAS